MDEELRKRAYLEGMKLKKSGLDNEVIFARLEKQGFPEILTKQVIDNITIQQYQGTINEQKPLLNIALIRLSVGLILAMVCFIIAPDVIILPIGFIIAGVATALSVKSDKKILEKAIKIIPLKTIIENIKSDMEFLVNDYTKESINVIWYGVCDINPKYLVFWICVQSDSLKTQLQNNNGLNAALRQLLEKHNYPNNACQDVHIGFESQETVDRESDGNWYHHFK